MQITYFRILKTKNSMKRAFLLGAVAIATTLISFKPGTKKGTGDTYKTTAESKIEWVGSKKGGYHPGYFSVKSGSVTIDGGKLTGGKFIIDVAGVKVTDGAGAKLEGHLKAGEFFEAEKFPEATFEITNVTYTSETAVEIAGTLNIKGTSVPLKFPGYIRSVDGNKFFAQAFFTLDSRLLPITTKYTVPEVPVSIHLFATK